MPVGPDSYTPSQAGFQRKVGLLGYLHCDTLCRRELNTEDLDHCVVNRAVDVFNGGKFASCQPVNLHSFSVAST